MKLSDDLYVLALPMQPQLGDIPSQINLSLILDAAHGPTLVDTGMPGQLDALAAALAEADLQVQDIKRIILTHQDIDHVGSLHDLVRATGAQVMAHATEIPAIDGTAQPRFASPELLNQRPALRTLVEGLRPTPVDTPLQDGTRLDLAGGVRVIATPGHTPGHISLYLERTGALISGDALTASEGRLMGPNEGATPDMAAAGQSIGKLADLDVRAIVCYHGGVLQEDTHEQLRRVAEAVAARWSMP
jgi:glyoxylase-like metal-dependent hydrolase (beta-lactamase superfamily II)